MAKRERPIGELWKAVPSDPDDECLSVEEILFRLRGAFPRLEEDAELGRRMQQEQVDRLKRINAPPFIVEHEQAAVEGAVYVVVSDPAVPEDPLDFVARADEALDLHPERGKYFLLKRVAEALDYDLEQM